VLTLWHADDFGIWKEQAEFDKAIADFNEVMELQPMFADAYVGRADM
jgi:hypothetical protein